MSTRFRLNETKLVTLCRFKRKIVSKIENMSESFERNFVSCRKWLYKAIFQLLNETLLVTVMLTKLRLNKEMLVASHRFERKIVGENREEAILFKRVFVGNSK